MKSFTKYLCLCLAFLLPFAAHAKFTGEVIFLYLGNDYNELWITHIENAKNPRLLYKHNEKEFIYSFAIQKDSPIIAISAGPTASNIFLIDRNRLRVEARNLTKNKFNATGRVALSSNGDLLFANGRFAPDVIDGLYLMPNDEIKKVKPQATLLKEVSIDFIRWSPNGQQFIYIDLTSKGLFLYNLLTGEDSLITKDIMFPAFSPDGKTLAFIFQPTLEPGVELDVISLETLHPQLFPNDLENYVFFGIKWPTENYLVYGIDDKQNKISRHYVIHIDGGPPEQILEGMEDMIEKGLTGYIFGNTTFAVEPTNRLTTVWGKLKTLNTK